MPGDGVSALACAPVSGLHAMSGNQPADLVALSTGQVRSLSAADVPLRLVENAAPSSDEGEIEVIGTPTWPLLPDAVYAVRLISYEVTEMKIFRGALRLFAVFELVDSGPYLGKRIYCAWPLSRATKSGGKTRWAIKVKSGLYMTLCRLLGYRVRADRVSLNPLKGCILSVRTRTVEKDFRQRKYPSFLQYSVVDEIVEIVSGHI